MSIQKKKQPIVFMFPGQGAQYYHMADSLYQNNNIFKEYLDYARQVLFDVSGVDLINELYNPNKRKIDVFDDLRVTQPSLLIVSVGIAKTLSATGIEPDFLLGTSLGEFSAAIFSGALDLEALLSLFQKHWEYFRNYCNTGAMISILSDLDAMQCATLMDYGYENSASYMPGHAVISGPKENQQYVEDLLKYYQLPFDVLPVNVAFHSSMLDSVREQILQDNNNLEHRECRVPIYSAASLQCVRRLESQYLWEIIRAPIQFSALIHQLESEFGMKEGGLYYIDVGPSGTLATFAKNNFSNTSLSRAQSVLTAFTKMPRVETILNEVIV